MTPLVPNSFFLSPFSTPPPNPTQLVKLRIADAREGLKKGGSSQPGASSSSAPLVYAVRLKGSGKVHRTLRRQGVDVDLKTIGATGPPSAQQLQ